MLLNDFLIRARANKYSRKQDKEGIVNLLLTHPHPEKVVDVLNDYDLCNLRSDVLKRSVPGYRNLYDYILKTKTANIGVDRRDAADIDLAYTWYINRNSLFQSMISDELLLMELPDGKRVIENAIEGDQLFFCHPHIKSEELAKIIYDKGKYDLLLTSDISVLRMFLPNHKTLLEDLLEKGYLPNIKYITGKKNPMSLDLVSEKQDILFDSFLGSYNVIDIIAKSGIKFTFDIAAFPTGNDLDNWKKMFLWCAKNNRYDLLETDLPESFLMMDLNGYEPIYVLNKYKVNYHVAGFITDIGLVKNLMMDANNYRDLVYKTSIDLLTSPLNSDSDYSALDFMIYEASSEQEKIMNVTELAIALKTSHKFNEKVALIFSKYDMYIIPDNKNVELGLNANNNMQKHIFSPNYVPAMLENKDLIYRFRMAFYDNKNSVPVIDSIVDSFNQYYKVNPDIAIRDLEALIIYKEQHPNFILKNDPSKANSFLGCRDEKKDGFINMENPYKISSLNHEWAHLVHELYADDKTPSEVKELVPDDSAFYLNKFKIAIEAKKRINEDADMLLDDSKYEDMFMEYITSTKGSLEDYKEEIRREYKSLIGSQRIMLDALKRDEMSRDTLDALSYAMCGETSIDYLSEEVVERYVNDRLASERKMFIDMEYSKNNGDFLLYENFIDAYYGGAIGDLPSHLFPSKAPTCTHNSIYFIREDSQFSEMFADFSAIKKMPNADMYLTKLREMTNPELIDFLEDYYLSLGKNVERN